MGDEIILNFYDDEEWKKLFDENDNEKLLSCTYGLKTSTTYVDDKDLENLKIVLDLLINKIYDLNDRQLQEAFFMAIGNAININCHRYEGFIDSVDKMVSYIQNNSVDGWELAESLIVISHTWNDRYIGFVRQYINHEDAYVREMANEFLSDMAKKV